MKERPIIFSGAMIHALIEKRKTQTRRVVKEKHVPIINGVVQVLGNSSKGSREFDFILSNDNGALYWSPYGKPGDRLWVRETWAPTFQGLDCLYKADPYIGPFPFTGRWSSPIHMPRWASRITLEIESIRVERLLDMTEGDAYAEGIEGPPTWNGCPFEKMKELWNGINGEEHLWKSNPWVWVIEFEILETKR